MASATALLAQSNPALLCAFPGWKQPTHVHLRATIGANGQPTVVSAADATTGDAGTTLGVTITETANDSGIYDVVFPPCRQFALGTAVIQVLPAVIGTIAQARHAQIDLTNANTSAKLGKLRFNTLDLATPTVVAPVSGSEVHLSFWADLG